MSEELVVIQIYPDEMGAAMAQELLRQSGVQAFVFKDDAGGMEPHLQRTNGVRLIVKREDAERARETLQT